MLVAALVLLSVLVVLSASALAVVVAPHLRTHRGRRVVVNLRSGEALTGQLAGRWGGRIELVDARLHEAGEARPIDGRAVVEKANVTFVQVLPALDPDAVAS